MAGHSHWANIAHKKGIVDKKRGKLFGKLNRAIIVAAQQGGDPAMNLALRYAIDKARQASMPKDTIERAIKKGTGELDGEAYDSVVYEGYGPGGVAILCDILTDNRNRTAGEIRKMFEVHGGNLGATNCVAWMFERKGLFLVPAENLDEERLFEIALEAGAEDVRRSGASYEIVSAPEDFSQVQEALAQAEIIPEIAEINRVPANTVELDAETGRAVLKLIDVLEDQDDVQSVTANYDLPDEVMAALA